MSEEEINKTAVPDNKKIGERQKVLEELFEAFETAKNESKEKQLHAKNVKEEIINVMNEIGLDEVIINGLDSVVILSITYPEREILDKKALAESLGVPQKELSKPQVIIQLTQEGKLTQEMISNFTITEERMQFNAQEYIPESD